MASKSNFILIPLNWKRDLFEDLNGEFNVELGGKRLAYLFLSMEDLITQEDGKQISSNDPSIDWVVKGLINQLQRMRGNTDDINIQIASLRSQGRSSKEIAETLSENGHSITDSGVRKTDGWKNFGKYLRKT